MKSPFLSVFIAVLLSGVSLSQEPINVSGVYPHLRMWNAEGECGTGATVIWQGDLWAITYAPHRPTGSTDKLYRVTPKLEQIIFPGSVGGTPANRMIHPETGQLLIGPYLIDEKKEIRVIPSTKMFGRLTGNARHLSDPENKVYYATMEEGLYEVDVNTLEVTSLIRDTHGAAPKEGVETDLPGYHGKGLYSGYGRVVYSNNGDRGDMHDPTVPSGALAQWYGEGAWQLVRRNQFTEVTGPGGISGNEHPDSDPIWAMGWDAKSLLLALLEDGEWTYYRLPKGSHSYDGSHGWNTEWPRIREIGEGDDLLATMHGTFWSFPSTFSRANSAGIVPRSNYLKVIGDFCRWGDRIVLGCDDSAKAEFLNTRPFKAEHAAPLESNSNFWFIEPKTLDQLGPAIGRGSVWLRDEVVEGEISDPYLFSGYEMRQLHLTHGASESVTFSLEVDREGTGNWAALREITVPANGAVSEVFSKAEVGTWVRLKSGAAATDVTANFQYRSDDPRDGSNAPMFSGIATLDGPAATTGVMRSLSHEQLGLVVKDGDDIAYYGINETLEVVPLDQFDLAKKLVADVRQPVGTVQVDAASVILIEDGKRYRLPKNERYPTEEAVSGNVLADYVGENLAKGAAVTSSLVHQDYAAENAVDGEMNTEASRWISAGGQPSWIELDFGAVRKIENVWVVTGLGKKGQYAAKNFEVQVPSGDGWVTPAGGSVTANTHVEVEVTFSEPVEAQRLRIVSPDADHFRVYEIAAFEKPIDIARHGPTDFGPARVCREVATERDLLNVHGTFYELPARNAQGLAKARPIATHNLKVQDFCSHNGLLFFTGIDAETASEHLFRSDDGKAAVWAGVIDDLWKLGKPSGDGGPWMETAVVAGVPSDPYLMTGYDEKTVTISASEAAKITIEVDVDGTGLWIPYQTFEVDADSAIEHTFPAGFSAYWVRATSDASTKATVQFAYR